MIAIPLKISCTPTLTLHDYDRMRVTRGPIHLARHHHPHPRLPIIFEPVCVIRQSGAPPIESRLRLEAFLEGFLIVHSLTHSLLHFRGWTLDRGIYDRRWKSLPPPRKSNMSSFTSMEKMNPSVRVPRLERAIVLPSTYYPVGMKSPQLCSCFGKVPACGLLR